MDRAATWSMRSCCSQFNSIQFSSIPATQLQNETEKSERKRTQNAEKLGLLGAGVLGSLGCLHLPRPPLLPGTFWVALGAWGCLGCLSCLGQRWLGAGPSWGCLGLECFGCLTAAWGFLVCIRVALGCLSCLGLGAWLGTAWGWSASAAWLPPGLPGLPGAFCFFVFAWVALGCLSCLGNLGLGLPGAAFGAWAASLLGVAA